MEIEIWKKLKGHNGKYEISSFGRLKSYARNRKSGRFLKCSPDVNGYPRVTFYNILKNTKKTVKLHKLVLDNFTDTYKKGLVVNHKDGNKSNNKLSNLEYVTTRENVSHYSISKKNRLSKFVGVKKRGKKWFSSIRLGRSKDVFLGIFKTQRKAHQAYKEYLKNNGLVNKYLKASRNAELVKLYPSFKPN